MVGCPSTQIQCAVAIKQHAIAIHFNLKIRSCNATEINENEGVAEGRHFLDLGKRVLNSIADEFAKIRELGVLSFLRGPRPKSELWIFEMRPDLMKKWSDRKNKDIGVDLDKAL